MAGYIGSTPVPQGIQEQQSFTATAGQTTFNTLGYTDGNTIRVTLNGVLLEGGGVDYTATNGSDIVLTAAASADDVLTFETFNEFQLVSQTMTTPTISGGTLKSNVTLKNDTEQDTDGGRSSKIIYQGEQSGGEISTLAEIQASHDGTADDEKGDLIFRTNDGSDGTSPTERARFDSSGNFLVGATTTTNLIGGTGNDGVILTPNHIEAARDGGAPLFLNRTTSDGDIADFRKDGTTVGTIGTSSNTEITLAGLDAGVGITDHAVVPTQGDGVLYRNDNDVDLGRSDTRFKDIYTSGGIYLGAASAASPVAANYLDDYEEGTWTLSVSNSNATLNSAYGVSKYTKIGNVVNFQAYVRLSAVSGSDVFMLNLPFTSAASPSNGNGAWSGAVMNEFVDSEVLMWFIPANTSSNGLRFYRNFTSTSTWDQLRNSDLASNSAMYLSGFYHSA